MLIKAVTINTLNRRQDTKMKKAAPYVFLAILFAGAGWYAITKKPDPVPEAVIIQTPPALPPRAAQIDETITVEPDTGLIQESETELLELQEPLLPLNESDPQIMQSLAALLGSETLQRYLVKGEVISRMVTTLDSLTSRQVPPLINPVKAVDGKMVVESDGEQLMMSPDNFARYDGYVQVLQNTDSTELLNLYQRYQPLFQQAWLDNGGEGLFSERLIEVIDELLDTPDVPGAIYLSKPEAVYVFDDPVLESMTAGQKLLVRMGSVNAVVVKQKLAEIKLGLQGE